jgi:Spy/CpxP family protein refolding chaperone
MRFGQRDYIALLVKDSISENEKQVHLTEITSQYKKTQLEVFRHFNQIKDIATDQQRQKMSQRFHQVLWEALFIPKR